MPRPAKLHHLGPSLLLLGAACAEGEALERPGWARDALAQAEAFHAAQAPVGGQYIVILDDHVVGASAAMAAMANEYRAEVKKTYGAVLSGFVAEMSETEVLAMLDDDRVRYIEEDGRVFASEVQAEPAHGLDRIDQSDLPLDGLYRFERTGAGVTAYIIDTGIRTTHADFEGRARSGFTAIDDGLGSEDCDGHGTHVAGTVGSATFGVAKGVDLVAVRVLGCDGSGAVSGVIEGVEFVAMDARGPAVANMSLGGGASPALDLAVRNATAEGIPFAVAAGNEFGRDACEGSPAGVPEALTVGAIDRDDRRADFSNVGPCVDMFAPGDEIPSTWSSSDTAVQALSGTSMASPHAAGAIALVLEDRPDASPDEVIAALLAGATAGRLSQVGAGSPNLLLRAGTSPPQDPDEPPGDPEAEVDLSGWVLRQEGSARELVLPTSTVLRRGQALVVARGYRGLPPDRADFEAFWGVALPGETLYLEGNEDFPVINGGERFSLVDPAGDVVDGPSASLVGGDTVERVGQAEWRSSGASAATPGEILSSPPGLHVSEAADALGTGAYHYEYVEIGYGPP